MAVRIDIPGIGVVEAEGIASEETLQRLAAALEKSSAGLTKDQKDQAKATKDSTKAIKENTTGWVAAGDAFTQSLKNMALTATSVATKFFANYDAIAASPIKAGQSLLNTAIDLTANLAGGLAGSIPIIGGFAKGVVDATAALAKMANDMFADQLQKNIDALQIYAKSGISFSGGMTQMQNAAQSAGLGIKDFASGVSKAKTDLNFLGMSGGDAANFLADRMGIAGKIVGKSGQTLRQEMLAMGFSYDEQIEVMASYMANMKAAGKLEKMSKEEIAIATRQYAADLKIVADFTGQDAKKQMERARAQQLMVVAQAKLSVEERDRLGKATSALGRFGPEADRARQAMTQLLINGTTNIDGYTMGPGRQMIESMVANIRSGQEDMYVASGRAMSTLQKQMAGDQMQVAISNAKLLNAQGGAIDGFAQLQVGAFAQGEITDEQIAKMREQAENQGTATDKLTTSFQTVYESAQKFKVEVEAMVNSKLGDYSKILADNFKRVTDVLTGKGLGGGGSPSNKEMMSKALTGKDTSGKKVGFLEQYFNTVGAAGQPGLAGAFADGGRIPSGKVGIAGETGPELVGGPSTILSQASTQQLIVALDAMREMKGERLGRNDFEWNVVMEQKRLATLKDRTSAFGGLDISALESELSKRPEVEGPMAKARAAMMEGEDQPTKWPGKEAADQTVALLSELVTAMKQNVSQTARVAMNTN